MLNIGFPAPMSLGVKDKTDTSAVDVNPLITWPPTSFLTKLLAEIVPNVSASIVEAVVRTALVLWVKLLALMSMVPELSVPSHREIFQVASVAVLWKERLGFPVA